MKVVLVNWWDSATTNTWMELGQWSADDSSFSGYIYGGAA